MVYSDLEELGPPVRFDDFQVYRVTPKTIQQLETLKDLEDNSTDYNFWAYVSDIGRSVDIMVPPHKKSDFLNLLHLQNVDAKLWIENVQERVDKEKRTAPRTSRKYDWKEYQTLEELNELLDSLVLKHPKNVRPVMGGQSHEGRKIMGVVVSYLPRSTDPGGEGTKIVFIEGGIHAREWISPATVTYILYQLLQSKESTVRKLAESYEWHVFPCVNPDGYVYSYTFNRMWRKNRKPVGNFIGVDLNRNWDFHWSEGRTSLHPGSDTFAGIKPFSETETKTLSRYIKNIANKIEVYLAFHSYSQKILSPFGHGDKPENHDEHQRIGQAAAESLASRYGTVFRAGNRAETLYPAGGVSTDWAKGVHKNIRLAFTYELRDTGTYGFLLPPEQIIPTAKETLDSVVRIFQELENPSSITPEPENIAPGPESA